MKIEEIALKRYIFPDKGFVLTNWTKENILDFTFAKQIIQPVTANYSDYYEISEEECKELQRQLREEYEILGKKIREMSKCKLN